jgi:copper(I)-binding protein
MKKLSIILAIVLVAVVASAAAVFAVVSSPEAKDVSVRLGTGTAGIFLDLENRGLLPDCAVGVEVMGDPGGMSLKAELHKTVMENNVMKMVKVDKVCVNPFSTVRMRGAEGEGYHIMVFGDVEHIKVFHIYLKFESGKVLHFHAETTGAEQGEHKH